MMTWLFGRHGAALFQFLAFGGTDVSRIFSFYAAKQTNFEVS
jgi:hypothetical protein